MIPPLKKLSNEFDFFLNFKEVKNTELNRERESQDTLELLSEPLKAQEHSSQNPTMSYNEAAIIIQRHFRWGKPLGKRTTERKVAFSTLVETSDKDNIFIKAYEGPKPENVIIGKIIDHYFKTELNDEEDFHRLFPNITDDDIATVVSYFAKSVTSLKEGSNVMIWDGSSRKIQPFWITASGGKGQAAMFEEIYHIISSIYICIRIRILREIHNEYLSRPNLNLRCSVSRIPSVLPRVPSY